MCPHKQTRSLKNLFGHRTPRRQWKEKIQPQPPAAQQLPLIHPRSSTLWACSNDSLYGLSSLVYWAASFSILSCSPLANSLKDRRIWVALVSLPTCCQVHICLPFCLNCAIHINTHTHSHHWSLQLQCRRSLERV